MMKKLKIVWVFLQIRWLRKFRTRQDVEHFQEKEIKKHLDYMREHSPYYANLSEETFPVMDKQKMMRHFDELNTVGVKKEKAFEIALRSEQEREFTEQYKDISVGLSSGTSGHRGLFLTSEKEQAVWAGTILAKMLPKKKMLPQKIAFFLRANNNLYETLDSHLLTFRYFDLYRPINNLVDGLIDYQPTILVAPASVLVDIAKILEEKSVQLRPRRVISVAEVLEERDAVFLKERFHTEVIHQIYQCTEGLLACTCERGHLHINEDMVRIEKEWIDDKRFYPIITDFRRTSQPFIRYRLNDILVLNEEPCACGSPFTRLEKIEGRSDDVFEFEGIHQEIVRVYPDFIRRCLLYVEDIMEYQVIQINRHTVDVRIDDPAEQTKQAIIEQFERLADQLGFVVPTIQFGAYERDRSKKLKRVMKESSEEK